MKRVFSKLVGIILIAVCASCDKDCYDTIKGNGNLLTSEKSVSTFEKIATHGFAEVLYYASEEHRVVVTVDSNLEQFVEIYTKNNVLNIGVRKNVSCSFTKYLVEVYAPVLTGVSLDGFGAFEGMDMIAVSKFESTISGSGFIKGAFECENFSAKISGFGELTITGNSKNTHIDISGSGKFNGKEFETKNATVNISGFGNVYMWVNDHLKATISGSGNLYYSGEPKVDSSVSGSGRIKKM